MISAYRCYCVYCFQQKTAYELRISDWSSYVCSSDLQDHEQTRAQLARLRSQLPRDRPQMAGDIASADEYVQLQRKSKQQQLVLERYRKIGIASCRERVCQYV